MLFDLKNQRVKLAPDWIKLTPTDEMIPAEQWPARSSYDESEFLYTFTGKTRMLKS